MIVNLKKYCFFVTIAFFLSLVKTLPAEEKFTTQYIFIRALESFDFERGMIVDINKGDINILPDGIEIANPRVYIAVLYKHFVEDVKSFPEEEATDWTNFVDYETGMVYAVRCANGKYAVFELLDVKVSSERVIGIAIEYKYQPDGSRTFD